MPARIYSWICSLGFVLVLISGLVTVYAIIHTFGWMLSITGFVILFCVGCAQGAMQEHYHLPPSEAFNQFYNWYKE